MVQTDDQKILITGGAGFIGSHIVGHLLSTNVKKIRILDNLSTGKKANIETFFSDDRVEFMYGDISSLEVCQKAMVDIDMICHQAALGSVPRSINDPLSSHTSNVNGFLNVLIAAHEAGIKRVVYASSSSVYGDHPYLPKREDQIGNVLSPYAATKRIDEIYAHVFTQCYNMECIGLRYFNVFGTRQNSDGPYAAVIPRFIAALKQDISPTIYGDGTNSRDFTFVKDIVRANILALFTTNTKCFGNVFNIGAGGRTTLNELLSIIQEILDKQTVKPIYMESRKGDIAHSWASIDKARVLLGYEPLYNIQEGLQKMLKD